MRVNAKCRFVVAALIAQRQLAKRGAGQLASRGPYAARSIFGLGGELGLTQSLLKEAQVL